MKYENGTKTGIVYYFFLLCVYNISLFLIMGFRDLSATFWISWGFMMAAFVSLLSVGLFLLKKDDAQLRDWILGYPVIKHCIIHLIVEFAASTIFIVLEAKVNWKVALVVQLVLFTVHATFVITAFVAKHIVEHGLSRAKTDTAIMKAIRMNAKTLFEMCTDKDAKVVCKELYEAARFADPVSSAEISVIDESLESLLAACREAMEGTDFEQVKKLCQDGVCLLKERSIKSMANKY